MIRQMIAITAVAVAVGNPAVAEELKPWGDSGEWAILIDPSVGNGCLMQKKFDTGTLIQLGFVPDREGGFFAAYNADWTDIEDGATGIVTFDFPKIRFSGEVVGVVKEDIYGGFAFFDNPNVAKEIARNNDMTIVGEMGRTIEVNLSGTMKAIAAVKACQAEQPQ